MLRQGNLVWIVWKVTPDRVTGSNAGLKMMESAAHIIMGRPGPRLDD